MTAEQLPAPVIPAHATTFPASGGLLAEVLGLQVTDLLPKR